MSHEALVCLRSWGLGRFVRPLSLALVKAGAQTLVWKFCARTGSLGAPRQPLPVLVNTHSPVRSSLARVSAAKSIVRMLRWVLGGPSWPEVRPDRHAQRVTRLGSGGYDYHDAPGYLLKGWWAPDGRRAVGIAAG
jgi:hypothetical protein